jgi:hypothetical protein
MAKKAKRFNLLTRGTEICPVCHQSYLRELEYRCFDCDAPMCPTCVVIEKASHSCPECYAHGGE